MEKKSKIALLLMMAAGLVAGLVLLWPLWQLSEPSPSDEERALYKKQARDYKKIAEEYHKNLEFFQGELGRNEVYREMARKHKKDAVKFEKMAHKALYDVEIERLQNSERTEKHRKELTLLHRRIQGLLKDLEKLKGLPKIEKKDLLSLEKSLKSLQKELMPSKKTKGPKETKDQKETKGPKDR